MSNGKQPSKQQIADNMKSKADQASREMKTKGREHLERQEAKAADTMDKVADAVEAAARELRDEDETTLSNYVSEMSRGIGTLSSNLRERNTDDLIRDASRLARNNPGLFLLGSVAVGFGLARVAKAKRPESGNSQSWDDSDWEDYYGQQRTTRYGRDPELGATTGSSPQSRTAQSSTGASALGRTATGARDTGTTAAPGATGTSGSTGTSNPTHASTSYLPEDGSSGKSSVNPPQGESRTPGSST